MKIQLIVFPDQSILVTDEKVTGCPGYNPDTKEIQIFASHPKYDEWGLKIIAGRPGLPSINFSALSEEVCKTIGWVDLKKLAESNYNTEGWREEIVFQIRDQQEAFIKGFKTCQSLNEKKFNFSEEELIDLIVNFVGFPHPYHEARGSIATRFVKSISQLKVFDVEVEMDRKHYFEPDVSKRVNPKNGVFYKPKISSNSIKVTKIL